MEVITELIICRACESQNNLIELHKNVFKKFQYVTGLEIDIQDELPRWICTNCIDSLESSNTFKSQCENTDRKLRDAIASATQNSESSETIEKPIKNEPIEYFEIVLATNIDQEDPPKKPSKIKSTKTYKCETCSDEFDNFIEFNTHKKTHGNQRFQCEICQRWFPRLCYLTKHQIVHTESKDYECKLCFKTYKHRVNLDRHINVFHEKKKGHVCDICGKDFSQSSILKQHRTVHQDDIFECEICPKKFKSQMYLNRHKENHLPKEEQKIKKYLEEFKKKAVPFVCAICGKISGSQVLHQTHLRTHTGEKPFECPTCQKRFAFIQSLQTHLLVHTGAKPYKCETCGLKFRQLGHLKGHKLVHSGEKKFKCLVCGKSFALGSNLKVHMRTHTGETLPFKCEECPKTFFASSGLEKHKLIHL